MIVVFKMCPVTRKLHCDLFIKLIQNINFYVTSNHMEHINYNYYVYYCAFIYYKKKSFILFISEV